MLGSLRSLARSDQGAIAPLTAMSLFALIAVGGVAFDYARLANMDTELQQAADQAALAAATQLDRASGAQARAGRAIQDPTVAKRLAANLTAFANDGDGDGASVEIEDITFCEEFDDTEPDTATACDSTNLDNMSRFVVVTTKARTAEFAFTPIVAVFSADVTATAVAGVESAICNVAPLLVCVSNNNFPTDDDIGKGVRLKPLDGVSGNYGLLDFGRGTGDVTNALLGHGLNGCQDADDNETEPGTKTPVTDAINTRLDVYDENNNNVWNKQAGTARCASGATADGTGCPAKNARKDVVVMLADATIGPLTSSTPPTQAQADAAAAGRTCPADPKAAGRWFVAPASPVKGFQRDDCHYVAGGNGCGTGIASNFGDGTWDRTGYFAQNHPGEGGTVATFAGKAFADLTRYDIYRWESENAARMAFKKTVSVDPTPKLTGPASNRRYEWTIKTQCSYSLPYYGSPVYAAQKDRRVLPVVAANCANLKGKGQAFIDYQLLRVFDIFLTEPSFDRTVYPGAEPTSNKEIYGEVIGPAEVTGGGSGFQYYSRNRPYLVR